MNLSAIEIPVIALGKLFSWAEGRANWRLRMAIGQVNFVGVVYIPMPGDL